ncbi:hypothetical protein DL771_001445 [Monosporascus sp. 5C6A]|nr:hypothetical protein DL771_001445 [Monosporascus sp. 5C6A]
MFIKTPASPHWVFSISVPDQIADTVTKKYSRTVSKMAGQQGDVVGPWITFNAPEHDPAWAFKQAMEKYKAPPASKRLEERKNRFRVFMDSFLAGYKDKGPKKVSFDGTTTWPEVLDEATQAFDDYTKRGRSWRHPFRSTQRLFGTVACRIEFLIELLPDGDYTGIICGGLTLVYNAARRKRDLQELIIRTLDSLSEHVEGTKAFLRMYAWDEEVRKRTEDLYIAILEAIEALSEWLQRSSLGEAIKALLEQGDYGKELEAELSTNLQDKATSFGDCVSLCLHKMVQAIHQNVLTVGNKVEQVDTHIAALKLEALHSLEEHFHGMSKDVEWQINRLEERQRNWYLQAMQSQTDNLSSFNLATVYMPMAPQQPAFTIPHLLALLGFSCPDCSLSTDAVDKFITATIASATQDLLQADQNFNLFFGRGLSPQRQAILSFATQSHQFRTWFRSMASGVLIIHGMEANMSTPADSLPTGMVSATSYLCALLSQTVSRLSDSGRAYPLSFFCRLHGATTNSTTRTMDSDGRFQGPCGMMRFLIAQVALVLATNMEAHDGVDLSAIGGAEAEAIQNGDLNALCLLFDHLLKQVGVGVVVCMLDWVSWFERDPFLGGMHTVMHYFNSLVHAVEESQTGLVFKLLVTSPLTTQFARDWFPRQEELYLPGGMLMGGQGFGDARMDIFMATQGLAPI